MDWCSQPPLTRYNRGVLHPALTLYSAQPCTISWKRVHPCPLHCALPHPFHSLAARQCHPLFTTAHVRMHNVPNVRIPEWIVHMPEWYKVHEFPILENLQGCTALVTTSVLCLAF